ncbi:MAG: hypothetical protein QOF78_2483 [Phycisphaerales bacterium]|jgi:Xaa-Pro aminopeptidase|nr:hypothetical protein [Phycisphaerales bacterium]
MSRWRLDAGQIEVLDEDLARVLRSKTPAQRVAMIGEAHRIARRMLEAAIRRRRPDLDDAGVALEVARSLLRGTA